MSVKERTKSKAEWIRELLDKGFSRKEVAALLNVKYQYVYQVNKAKSNQTNSKPAAEEQEVA